MAEIKLTLEETLKIKESIEWGYNYYTEELNQLGYTHQVKDNNELEVYDENGNFVGKSFLGKEGQTSTRKFEAAMEVPEQVAELSNQLLLIKISLGYSERDIALLQQENLVQEPEAKYGSKEEVPARIFPAPEHGNLKNISFEGIPSEEVRNYLKEHSWRYSRRNRAWYPGTKEAQASNEAFVKDFLEKFYPNTLSEEQIPQTLFDTIPEERETEAIPESDVNNPHSDFPDVDNQDMAEPDVDHQNAAEPVPESPNEEQSSPEAIAPKTEYNFTPTIGDDGIIDYTGVEADKIRLPSQNQILNQFLPSYLPPVEIRRNGRYDIPAVKVADNQYLLKGTRNGGPIYRVSLDVYAALIDYHLKYDRAAGKAVAEYNNNALKEALENEQTEFFPLRTKFPTVPEPLSFESHCQPEKKRVGPYKYSSGRVSLQRSSSSRMTRESYYFIQSEIGSGNTKIFSHHQQILEDLYQKLLDMELQHSDLESTWTKGRETAYGDSNLDESLLATYGVNIKRQNGNTLSANEKTELKEVLNQVYSTYGDLSSITKDYGLKISHSGTTRMHASKAVGLFTPGMKALGISFGLGKDEAIYTANHEMAHFIDHLRGKEHHAWHASDIPGTLENKIAATFRQGMNTAKGDYWNRTCECFARAMEEYGKIVHIQQEHPDWDSEKINEKVSLPAYMDYTKFYSTMIPLIQEWIETTHSQMKISEWHLQDSDSLKQKNVETEKITKSQSKGIREECLEILKKDDSQITSDDLATLKTYEGAGGLGEKNASVNGVLNEFYTPNLVVQKMWQLADAYVPNAITVLEPTAGTGRFAEGRNNNQFTMYEVDKTSARINQLLHPQATVINESFQKQFFDPEGRAINRSYSIPKFDLVIGNPPYGDYKDKWRGLGEGKEFDRYEEYFLSRGIDSLKNQDSLMIMIVPSGFLNSNEDKVKQAISSKGKLLDAWRLPEGVFPTTKVGTDILVFQRGSCQVQELCNGNWFKNHPEKILGQVKTRTNRFGREEEYVDFFAGHTLSDTLNLLVPDKSIDKLLETSSNFIEETLQENQRKEFANAESIHQGDRERETHLRGEGVGGQTREDNGTNVPGQDPRGGGIIKEPGSPDSTVTRKPVQQPSLQHNSPAPERNDSHTSGSLGNQAGRQGGMEPHTTPLPGSIEQLSDRLTLSAQEFSQFYTGNNFSQEEYPILLATDWQGKVDSSTLSPAQREWLASSEKYIPLEEGKFVNRNIFCSGNIYHKLAELESRKDTIPTELYNIQKKALEESLPPIKSLDKVELSPLGSLAESFLVTRELTRTNYDYLSQRTIQTTSQEEIPLSESFIAWATGCYQKDTENGRRYISDWTTANISREDLPSNVTWNDIVDYIEGVSVKSARAYTEESKIAAKIEAEEKRQARKETAERLFNRYIRTALPEHDREQLTQEWNKRFNSYVAPDYSKLPVLVDGMSTRKDNKPFELYSQQVKGVAFLTQKGNGLLAYDVGVGKTAAGIVATVSQLQSGRAKRPLIIVPKAVYTKWINDFTQLFPNIPINDLANFSPNTLKNLNNGNHGLSIPEGSISFCTNEALQRITFEDESIEGALFEDFSNLLGKSDEAHSDNPKIRAKAISAINDEIGTASQTKDDYVFFERCGFDHITVDEAHRFKNLFRAPRSSKPDSKGMSQEFPGLGQGKPSMRAMKMFAITQMVQRNNDNRNVFMLTATPFTNSPLEVYSMLSYIGREQLKSSGVYDIRDFCTEYANVTNEWAVDAKGVIKPKSVMKSFRNPQSLQSLITQFIDKVDGEEAGIKRPNKEQHQIQLEMNEVQKMIVARETERMLDPAEKDKGGVLIAMNNMRMAMVSPALLDSSEYPEIEDFPTDIVESSPKLQYVCDTASQIWKEKAECGQVIYMPYGVKEMDSVKDALVKRGVPASCIGIIRPGDNLSEEKIDEMTSNFNNKSHQLKILIGSKKISEGVDLNGNSIALYNTMLDWNPTETIQVEGRIWRQGNKQERVHIMYPLMEDSIESLIFQKHDEKSNRINDIFSYKGDDALDVSSINPEELKFDLIKDPQKKADFIISQKTVEMKKELTVVNARISTLNEIALKKANLQDLLRMAEASGREMQERLDFPERREKWFSETMAKEVVKNSKTEVIQLTAKIDTLNRRLQKMGITDEAAFKSLESSLEGQKDLLQKQIDMVASNRDKIIEEEKTLLLERKAAAVPFQQQVATMVRHIIENTKEAPQKERRIEEHHKKVSEKPQSVSTPQRQEIASNEKQLPENESPIEYPVGKYGQLELFAFEQTPSYNNSMKAFTDDFVKQIKTADQIVYMDKEVGRVATWLQEKAGDHVPLQGINTRVINSSYNTDNLVSIPSLIAKSSATVQEPVSQYITSGDPSLTKEHIWRAKAATRTYCNPILDGKKSGLWKNFRDFKKHGVLDILGANAEMEQGKITPQGWNQLATALQIYRDKRFETFRYLFVSPEGKIKDQLAVCSHLPGKTLSNLPSENLLGQVITHAEETGTKVVLVHNHPSGNITPSVDDIRMTKTTEAAFTRSDGKCLLAGHIILDHDSYSLYQKGKEWEARMLSPYDIYDPLLKTRNPMEGITVSGPESLELVAQAVNSHDKWKEEGWVPVVFTNSGSQISAVKMYPEDFLTQNNAKLLNQLQETAKRTGAVMAFPIILDKNHISQENQKNLLDRMKAGCFTDFYLGEKDGSFRTSEDFNLIPGKNLFDEVGMEQMAEQTNITSTFPRHQKYEMESLGLFVAEEKKEYESFLGQIDDYLKRGKLPEYNRFILTQTPSILEFTGIPQNHVLLSTGVLNKARKIHGLDNKEIMDSVKGLFNPMLVFSSDKSTSEAKNDSILVITEATAKNGKPVALALELNKALSNHKQIYVVNDIRSIHDRSIVAQNGVDILKKWTEKGLLRYYDDKKISDWLELRRVQFPLSLTKSDMSMIADKNTSVKTRSQFENSLEVKSSSTLSAEDLNYIHSDEFISRFGDWEKANRLEKLKLSESIILSSQILLNGKDYTESINKARSVYSKENIRELTKLANAIGKETLNNLRLEQNLDRYTHPKLLNYDLNKEFVLNLDGFKETSHHNILQKGHIEGIANIPQIIQEAKYISAEDNEDNRKPDITKFHYFALGIKIDNEDYTGKVVFAEKKNGEMYYDQSLSTIEKGNLIDNIMKKNKLETSFELEKAVKPINRRDSFQYYDKRLINICQVPQLPYLDENLIPTKKTIEAVKRGELYIQRQNQKSYMVDTTVNPLSRHTPLHLESDLPEKLLTPAQIRERKQELPVKHSFMVNNSFIPPMELAKNGQVQLYCSSEDLQNPISQNSQEIKPVVLEMTPKQAAVLVDASIKKQSMENRLSKQQLPLNLPAKSKMEESFFTGLKNVHPQLTRKEAERQYHEVYSMIEKELKDLRIAPAIERKTPQRKDFSMEW